MSEQYHRSGCRTSCWLVVVTMKTLGGSSDGSGGGDDGSKGMSSWPDRSNKKKENKKEKTYRTGKGKQVIKDNVK